MENETKRTQENNKLYLIADALLVREECKEAIRIYQKIIKNDNNSPKPYIKIGQIYKLQNKFDKARENFTTAIDKGSKEGYLYRGQLYFEQKEYNEAIQDFNKCMEDFPETSLYRGQTYFELKEYEKAIQDFDTFLNLGNKYSEDINGETIDIKEIKFQKEFCEILAK